MKVTPKELYGITKAEWFEYEALRRSGKTNMWGASRYLSFDCLPIMSHYVEMADAWKEEFETSGFEGAMTFTEELP